MMAIAAAAQGVVGLGQTALSAFQRRSAEKNFDKFQVPQGINSMMDLLQGMASQNEIPGADMARQRIAAGTARGVEAASRMSASTSDVLGSLHRMYSNQMDQEINLAMAGAQQKQQNQMRLAQGMQTLGAYQTQKWQYNELYPYMQKMTAAGQTAAAGAQNIAGALQSGLNLAVTDARLNAMQPPGADGSKSPIPPPFNVPQQSNNVWNTNTPQMNKNFWMDEPLQPQQQQALPAFSNGPQTNQNPWMANIWGQTTPQAGQIPYDLNKQYNAPWF